MFYSEKITGLEIRSRKFSCLIANFWCDLGSLIDWGDKLGMSSGGEG